MPGYGYMCEICHNKEKSLLMSKDMVKGRDICCVCYWKYREEFTS